MAIEPVLAEAIVMRTGLRAHRPPKLSSPQLKETVGTVTELFDNRIASPLRRLTAPVLLMENVVALEPRMVVPREGAVRGDKLT